MHLFVLAVLPLFCAAAPRDAILRCAYLNHEKPHGGPSEECTIPGATEADKAHFCYVLYKNSTETQKMEPYMKGCWVGGEHECVQLEKACYTRKNGLLFCCCLGDECNGEHFEPTDPIEYSANFPLPDGIPEKADPASSIVLRYVIAPILGLLAILILSYLGIKKHRKANLSQLNGYDNSFEKTPSEAASPMLQLKTVSLIQEAAQGRFGSVWRGMHHDVPVAVKIFPAGERQSWEKELEVYRLPQMQHPNLLRFMGAACNTNAQTGLAEYWLLTTWHDIGSLYDFLKFNTISYTQMLHISDTIAKGVMHLHTEHPPSKFESYKPAIAHRDIKSKNIILKDDRTACIADFGLAIVFEAGSNIGETHGQVGTRRYMAPEVLEGAISFDQEAFQRIDMYAVSLVLWEVLSRCQGYEQSHEFRLPFEDQVGQHPSLDDMQETVVNRKSRPAIKDEWREDTKLSSFINTLEDCWDADADARLNACTVHERIQQLMSNQWTLEIAADSERTALLKANGDAKDTNVV